MKSPVVATEICSDIICEVMANASDATALVKLHDIQMTLNHLFDAIRSCQPQRQLALKTATMLLRWAQENQND